MKTIGRRIAVWYAVAATLSLACLFAVGHYLLETYLVRQLDSLNETEFIHLKDTLGPNYETLAAASVADRIREVTESASSLFYIDMHGPMTNRFFGVLWHQSFEFRPRLLVIEVRLPGAGKDRGKLCPGVG